MKTTSLLSGAILAVAASAQQTAYGQCGGIYWTGATTCVAGWYCSYSNDYYSQCLQGTGTVAATTSKSSSTAKSSTLSTSTKASTSSTKASTTMTSTKVSTSSSSTKVSSSTTSSKTAAATGKLKFLGVNESGAEFGQASYPGVWGTHFIFPSLTTLTTLIGEGYNMFRIPFAMERMAPNGMTGAFSAAYLANLTTVVNHITNAGAYAVLDPHNFGRYNGAIITDYTGFGTFWGNLATVYASNSKVVFDTNNEYHDEDQTLVLNMNQAAINAIRATGATSQYIFVEGNSYSGAWTWPTVNDNLKALTDPQNKLVYEMHQYLDSDGSGTSDACVSSTIGAERVASATAWLKANGKQGIIGEFAGGANSQCLTAVTGLLDHLKANSDVWMGAMWWGGGPWWGTYIYGFEPPSSTGYNYYDTLLKTYKP